MLTRARFGDDDLLGESAGTPPIVGVAPGQDGDDESAGAPVARAVPTPVKAVSAQKAWALKSVLKVFTVKADPNYGQPWQMCPQRSSSGSAFVVDVTQVDAPLAAAAAAALQAENGAPSTSTSTSSPAPAPRLLILTNSHVVTNATAMYVRRPGVARKFKAELVCDSKVCDLALLTVRDPTFWTEDLRPLTFVDVPDLQASIAVVGHPVGGDSLCITKGIVSRLALVRYSAAARLLGIQIDAAINPGNSGGPAFSNLEQGLVAGVAFSKNISSSTDNIGYIIPWRVVRYFVHEYLAHGEFRGVPSPGFVTQDLENPAQKAYFKMPPEASGVLVVSVDPLAPAAGLVKINDVLMEVDGEPVADDGTTAFRDDERLEYTHLVRSKHVGDTMQLGVWREGQRVDVSCGPLDVKDHLVPLVHGVDAWPSYFIIGGLVFTPLSSPFLEMVFGVGKRGRRADIPVPILQACIADKQQRGEQVVVLVQVLAHEINHGYHKLTVMPCDTFNGTKVHNLRHLATLVDQALVAHTTSATAAAAAATAAAATAAPSATDAQQQQQEQEPPPLQGGSSSLPQAPPSTTLEVSGEAPREPSAASSSLTRFLNFGLEGGRLITLERGAVLEHGPGILQVHAIPADRSEDLRQPDTLDAHWQTPQTPPQPQGEAPSTPPPPPPAPPAAAAPVDALPHQAAMASSGSNQDASTTTTTTLAVVGAAGATAGASSS